MSDKRHPVSVNKEDATPFALSTWVIFTNRAVDYTPVVALIRVIAILLLTSLISAQQASSPEIGHSNTPKPKLPFITESSASKATP